MSIAIRLENEKAVMARIDAVMPRLESEMTSALDKGLEVALGFSQDRVPVRSGDLKSTGAVTKTQKVGGNKLSAQIGYGGSSRVRTRRPLRNRSSRTSEQ